MNKHILGSIFIALISFVIIGGCYDDGGGGDGVVGEPGPEDGGPPITISPNVPYNARYLATSAW